MRLLKLRTNMHIAEGGGPAAGIEPPLDVLEDGGPCLGAGRPGVAVDELLLQRGVEARWPSTCIFRSQAVYLSR
jgi:hypothetical protein